MIPKQNHVEETPQLLSLWREIFHQDTLSTPANTKVREQQVEIVCWAEEISNLFGSNSIPWLLSLVSTQGSSEHLSRFVKHNINHLPSDPEELVSWLINMDAHPGTQNLGTLITEIRFRKKLQDNTKPKEQIVNCSIFAFVMLRVTLTKLADFLCSDEFRQADKEDKLLLLVYKALERGLPLYLEHLSQYLLSSSCYLTWWGGKERYTGNKPSSSSS